MNKHEGRFAAIFLAILVPAGFWLGMEYLNHAGEPVSDEVKPPAEVAGPHVEKVRPAQDGTQVESLAMERQDQAATAPASEKPAVGGVFKCQHNGRVTYTDKPDQQCDQGAQATRMAPVVANAGIAPAKPYQQQLAELEREQAHNTNPAEDQARRAQRDSDRAAHEQLCRNLADEITWIDSALRQPHDAHTGDDWTARRRRATDRRYSERC